MEANQPLNSRRSVPPVRGDLLRSTDRRVFVVDDDPLVLQSLSRMLTAGGLTVEAFPSAEAFLAREPHDGPGCLLLDQMMPDVSGLELVHRLGPRAASLSVVFLTAHADVGTSVAAMKAGAFDFLLKPIRISRLVEIVTRALDHSRELLDKARARRELAARFARLTAREREVCRFVARGFLNKQIAAELGASEKTIKIHRARVLHKLHVGSAVELARLMQQITEP